MTDYKAYLAALQHFSGEIDILYDEPMARHTTFRIGGPADVFLTPRGGEALAGAVRAARALGVPCAVVGNGSNLLVRDEGYRGVVVCTGSMRGVRVEETAVYADAGAPLSQIARAALDAGLTGFEFAAGIPGSLGGAVFMNAGAYGGQMEDVLTEVWFYDEVGARRALPASELALGYRTSVFKQHPEWTIAGAALRLAPGDPAAIRARMDDLAGRRRDKQPLDLPSAGSTFKRPEGYFAGKLIDDAGCRGLRAGGAQISEKHAGFVVNTGGATCSDVLELIGQVRERVRAQSGVSLECEVRLL